MIHQTEMVIGVGVPGTVDFERAGGLAVIGVAQVRGDASILCLELFDRVEGRTAAGQARDRSVQSSASNDQQRKTGTGLIEVDANGASFVSAHGSSPCPRC